MKRFIYLLVIGFLMSAVVSCKDDEPVPPQPPTPVLPDTLNHVVILYMSAQNNLSSFVYEDLKEIEDSVNAIPLDCRVMVYVDKNYDYPKIYQYNVLGKKEVYSYQTEHVCTDSLVMVDVLQHIMKLSPARSYSLVFWSHGSGWVPGKWYKPPLRTFGNDNGKEMEIPAMRWALEQFPQFRFIFFDACFMQGIEVAYELKERAQWMIGSPAEIPGSGAPYDRILRAMCEGNVPAIVQRYHDYYTDPNGAPLSAIDMSKLDTLAKATASVLPSVFAGRVEADTTGIQTYCGLMGKTEQFGMKSAMYHLLADSLYQSWVRVFDEAVPVQVPVMRWTTSRLPNTWRLTDPEHYGGVNMFIPNERYETYGGYNRFFRRYGWYKAAGWDATGW
ncbi:MAG: hypothetical protein HUK03_02200 [Bacteroidaceae bacterium]|nr:hypothetical protein [Bacteroidaceae bacterium]